MIVIKEFLILQSIETEVGIDFMVEFEITRYLRAMRAKKSYGQHFLLHDEIAKRIADALELKDAYNNVLEVGPGKGMLTQFLIAKDFNFKAVEADWDMADYLRSTYGDEFNKNLIEADFMKLNLREVFDGDSFALIGNYPYNISSQILFKTVEHRDIIPEMVGMFQKEVAQRVVSKEGNKTYGVVSLLIQAYYDCSLLFTVKKGSFSPPPKVESAVIRLTRKENYEDLGCDYKHFRQVVKISFGMRRKMLRNSLKSLINDREDLKVKELFNKRPEQLSLEEFIDLTNLIFE